MADLPIAEFNVSDGFTPQQINKLNSNFRSISNKILEAISMTGEASNKANNTLNIISNAFDIMNGFLPLAGGNITGPINRNVGSSGITYIDGNKGNAALYLKKGTGDVWYPAVTLDTTSGGSWAIGNYNTEDLVFSWASKANRDSNTNSTNVVCLPNRAGIIPVPTALYGNNSGSNATITLSETAANFNYLRIFFYGKSTASGSATKYECVEVYAPNGKIVQLSCTGQGKSGDTGVIFFSKMVTISAKSVSSTSYCSASIDTGGSTCAKNNEIYIIRVEGWK